MLELIGREINHLQGAPKTFIYTSSYPLFFINFISFLMLNKVKIKINLDFKR